MSPRTEAQNEEIRKQTRQQILDAAFELFANDGFTKTSIASVAKKAGVSKGLIYHYFDSKEAILEGIFDQLVHLAEEMLSFPEDYSSTDKIRQVIEQAFQFIEHQTGLGRLIIGLALQPDTIETLHPKIDQVKENQMVLYIGLFNELGYKNPETEAYKFEALMDGVLLGYASLGEEYPLEEMKTKIMEEYVPS
ncbi:TetR/AcrR family transcriptional regulator [Gracilimonas mengyeensis]|uniref:Transcriptional regulator, TetR family n=1 Tax=Gracilimonas mengyeensis TaxID=1302730 RepID=A0A521BFH7_9BACT|nr:TetR/AcrR family transcriptional regulator [Gracilimonas mengyeensis]SMO45833.1 transcriptional regulator, TetR family [Gracilimonas mengyeensis]